MCRQPWHSQVRYTQVQTISRCCFLAVKGALLVTLWPFLRLHSTGIVEWASFQLFCTPSALLLFVPTLPFTDVYFGDFLKINSFHGFAGNEKLPFPMTAQVKLPKRPRMEVENRGASSVSNLCKAMDACQSSNTRKSLLI